MVRKTVTPSAVYQIKIVLINSKPLIWRRVLVEPDMTLEEIHYVVQTTMPWTNSHLHQFHARDGARYADPAFELDDTADETRVRLDELLVKPKDRIVYEYDFGDGWNHAIELEKIVAREPKQKLPVCVAGKRAAPPDDCGGVWGYEHLLEVLADPDHEEHEDLSEWVGGQFDAEAFDLKDVNRAIRRFQSGK